MARRTQACKTAHYYATDKSIRAVRILPQKRQERCRDRSGHVPRPRLIEEVSRGAGFTQICTRCGASLRVQ